MEELEHCLVVPPESSTGAVEGQGLRGGRRRRGIANEQNIDRNRRLGGQQLVNAVGSRRTPRDRAAVVGTKRWG